MAAKAGTVRRGNAVAYVAVIALQRRRGCSVTWRRMKTIGSISMRAA